MSIMDIFTGGVIKDVGEGLDNLFTSDEERLQAKNVFAAINERITAGGRELSTKINQALTDRHNADMMSDSWLSKNIRPLTLILLTFTTILYLIWGPEEQVRYDSGLALLTSLDMMIYGFYFGSRGVEKAMASFSRALVARKEKKKDELSDMGW